MDVMDRTPPPNNPAPSGPSSNPEASQGSPDFRLVIETKTGRIMKIGKIDANGVAKEISPEELSSGDKEALSKFENEHTIEDLLESSFEAGLNCLFGDAKRESGNKEDPDVTAFEHVLLKRLIEKTPAQRALTREVLGHAIVATLVHELVASSAAPTQGSAKA